MVKRVEQSGYTVLEGSVLSVLEGGGKGRGKGRELG